MDKIHLKKVNFRYETGPEHRTFYANGAFGGITGKGDVRIGFFIEMPMLPKEEFYEVTEDSDLKKIPIDEEQKIHVREIQSTIVMSIENARSINTWLNEKLSSWDQIQSELKTKMLKK